MAGKAKKQRRNSAGAAAKAAATQHQWSREGEYIEWLAVKDEWQAVLDDVTRIRSHPLIPKTIPVHGSIYDVKSGKRVR